MKKLRYLLFMLAIILSAGTISVNALTTSITKATYDGDFTIEGTGTGQIQIVLFDLEGKPLYLTTVLAENNSFSIKLPKIEGIEEGNYKVKIANYDGKSVDSETIVVSNSLPIEEKKEETNPQTADNLLIYITAGFISLTGLLASGIYLSRKKVSL